MSEPIQSAAASTNQLVTDLFAKVDTHRAIISRSLNYGRVTWRRKSNGDFDIFS